MGGWSVPDGGDPDPHEVLQVALKKGIGIILQWALGEQRAWALSFCLELQLFEPGLQIEQFRANVYPVGCVGIRLQGNDTRLIVC